ncbi:MAG: hypothetical protein E7445_07665 [Ruminococcaceae bacterium]|nr:hypothetical protein [Oscillospiraceae bacterium]
MSMKRMTMRKKRYIIIAATVVIAAVGWWFLETIGDKWALAVAVVGTMVEWQLIRCPMCGRHLGWLDKEICASCAAAIAENEERERRR